MICADLQRGVLLCAYSPDIFDVEDLFGPEGRPSAEGELEGAVGLESSPAKLRLPSGKILPARSSQSSQGRRERCRELRDGRAMTPRRCLGSQEPRSGREGALSARSPLPAVAHNAQKSPRVFLATPKPPAAFKKNDEPRPGKPLVSFEPVQQEPALDSCTVKLVIRTPATADQVIQAKPGDTISDVKQRLENISGLASCQQRLFFAGQLAADHRVLQSIGLRDGSILELRTSRSGKAKLAWPQLPRNRRVSGLAGVQKVQAPVRRPEERRTFRDLGAPARELSSAEREGIAAVFRELGEDRSDRDSHGHGTAAWTDVVQRLSGALSAAHIQRLGALFDFPKRFRLAKYAERVGFLLTADVEQRLQVCFALLDVDGDAALGAHDVFTALMACGRCQKDVPDDVAVGITRSATFANPGRTGLDLREDMVAIEVLAVLPGSPADQQGVLPGDRVTHVNGASVEALLRQDALRLLSKVRPLQVEFLRLPRKRPMILPDDVRQLPGLRENAVATRIRVSVLGASLSEDRGPVDMHCTCEIQGKARSRFQTKTVNSSDRIWNETRHIADFVAGDSLVFRLQSSRSEDLGRATLSADQVRAGFDGELPMDGEGLRLRVRAQCLGDRGIGLSEFVDLWHQQGEPSFYTALAKTLTGTVPLSPSRPSKSYRLRVTVVSASGLRSVGAGASVGASAGASAGASPGASPGSPAPASPTSPASPAPPAPPAPAPAGRADSFCVCEVLGRAQSRVKTRVVPDSLAPLWNERLEVPDFGIEDSLRLAVYHKDGSKPDELLGQVMLSSPQLSAGIDGDLPLDGTKGSSPTLRVRIAAQDAPPLKPATTTQAGLTVSKQRFDAEVQELQAKMEASDVRWHTRIFMAICDDDMLLRRSSLVEAAEQLFGLPCGLLAVQLFRLLNVSSVTASILAWTQLIASYRDPESLWDRRVHLAFDLYDLDGDSTISLPDAVALAFEVDRLSRVAGEQHEGLRAILDEMRLLYGLVADQSETSSTKVDFWMFKQVLPQPAIASMLFSRLDHLAGPE